MRWLHALIAAATSSTLSRRITRGLHAAVSVAAFPPWLLGVGGFWTAWRLTLLADRIWPDATHGNCWSYVGPRWRREGGYLLVRWADPPMQRIPHVLWLRRLPDDADIKQTKPVRRARTWWQALRTLYFEFEVLTHEPEHSRQRAERRSGRAAPR